MLGQASGPKYYSEGWFMESVLLTKSSRPAESFIEVGWLAHVNQNEFQGVNEHSRGKLDIVPR